MRDTSEIIWVCGQPCRNRNLCPAFNKLIDIINKLIDLIKALKCKIVEVADFNAQLREQELAINNSDLSELQRRRELAAAIGTAE